MSLTTLPRSGNTQRERERIEFQLCRKWRAAGKLEWTDAELSQAVDALAKPSTATLPLFDTGEAAKESRLEAFKQASRTASRRRETVLQLFSQAGRAGLTRAEISRQMHCQQSDICQAVLELLRSGALIELTTRRKSQFGGTGNVLILPQFAEAKNCG